MNNNLLEEQKRLWAEIDLDNAEYNFRQIKTPTCCVIKANAYGHGAIQMAKLYESLGAFYFAVSNIEEAIQLRKAGITLPILILGYTPIGCVFDLKKYNLDQCVYSLDYARSLSEECEKHNLKIKIHVKIDTGMGRIGFQYHDSTNELNDLLLACKMPGLIKEGIFTHFATADEEDSSFAHKQAGYFKEAIRFLAEKGQKFRIHHCSNSSAIVRFNEYAMDMVRAGIILYGINPAPFAKTKLNPVLSLKSVVSNVKRIKKGDSVSYGRTYVADRDTQIVTIPVGYADGFWRSNQGGHVYINGKRCKIVGRVCMDQIMVECDNANIGDLVEIYGKHITIEEVAKNNHTIPYEVLCAIGERVPRVYLKHGEIVEIVDKLI